MWTNAVVHIFSKFLIWYLPFSPKIGQSYNVRHLKFRCVFVCLSHFFPKSPRRQIGRRFTDVDTVPGETPCFLWPLTQRRRTGRRRVVDSSLSKQWSFHTAAILAGSGEVNTGVPHDTVQGSVPFRTSQTHRARWLSRPHANQIGILGMFYWLRVCSAAVSCQYGCRGETSGWQTVAYRIWTATKLKRKSQIRQYP